MSVLLHDKQKFYRVYESLRWYRGGVDYNFPAQTWASSFGYPRGYRDIDVMEKILFNFCNDLYRANQATYQRQYEDARFPIESLSYDSNECIEAKRYPNNCALYKALQSIRYNLFDNAGKASNLLNCVNVLNNIIRYIADDIIGALPEYEKASWYDN